MGLVPCGESCMILTSTVFRWSTRVTDGWTDGQTDGQSIVTIAYARFSIYYMLSHAKTKDFATAVPIHVSHKTRALSTLSASSSAILTTRPTCQCVRMLFTVDTQLVRLPSRPASLYTLASYLRHVQQREWSSSFHHSPSHWSKFAALHIHYDRDTVTFKKWEC